MTIWTAVNMTDVMVDEKAVTENTWSCQNVTQTINNGTEPRLISTGVTGRMLGAGWLLYLFSLILNFIFYRMHPSSPEMWTWGAQEELEEWTYPEEEGEFKFYYLVSWDLNFYRGGKPS